MCVGAWVGICNKLYNNRHFIRKQCCERQRCPIRERMFLSVSCVFFFKKRDPTNNSSQSPEDSSQLSRIQALCTHCNGRTGRRYSKPNHNWSGVDKNKEKACDQHGAGIAQRAEDLSGLFHRRTVKEGLPKPQSLKSIRSYNAASLIHSNVGCHKWNGK